MNARILVEQAGLGVAAQDGGRTGYRALGVPLGGALDPVWLAAANALAGAEETAAGLEILLSAPNLRIEQGPLRIGLAGDFSGVVFRADDGEQPVSGWRGLVLQTGDRLALRLARAPGYLGFSGGLDLPPVLGSRSTFLRAAFGGLDGRTLRAGDVLSCAASEGERLAAPPFAHDSGPLRFISGPQTGNFTAEALEAFAAADWRVSSDSDRMGMRLSGPRLMHKPGGANILSDGATPGAIQVPGDGQPIVLRADCQTSGGYAKIGCIILADVVRAAHFAPGEIVRMIAVDHDRAAIARNSLREKFAQWRARIAPAEAGWDTENLWTENLIGGVISGDAVSGE